MTRVEMLGRPDSVSLAPAAPRGVPDMKVASMSLEGSVPPDAESASRIKSLDVLRGIAILLVLLHHYVVPPTQAGFISPLVSRLCAFGWTGVDLFFVLSGFLVGSLLMQEIQATNTLLVQRFLIRRSLKIWPQYYVYLSALAFVIWPMKGYGVGRNLGVMATSFFHIQNYSHRWMSQLWSLAVEEHFYLLLPVILLVFIQWGGEGNLRRWGAWVIILPIITIPICRTLMLGPPFDAFSHRFHTHIRLDSLAGGVLLAWIRTFQPMVWSLVIAWRQYLLVVAAGLLAPFVFLKGDERFVYTVGYTMIWVGYALILVWSLGRSPSTRTKLPPGLNLVAAIGTVSYGVYLWHYEAGEAVVKLSQHLERSNGFIWFICWMCLYVFCAVTAGTVFTRLIELPILRIRDSLFPRQHVTTTDFVANTR